MCLTVHAQCVDLVQLLLDTGCVTQTTLEHCLVPACEGPSEAIASDVLRLLVPEMSSSGSSKGADQALHVAAELGRPGLVLLLLNTVFKGAPPPMTAKTVLKAGKSLGTAKQLAKSFRIQPTDLPFLQLLVESEPAGVLACVEMGYQVPRLGELTPQQVTDFYNDLEAQAVRDGPQAVTVLMGRVAANFAVWYPLLLPCKHAGQGPTASPGLARPGQAWGLGEGEGARASTDSSKGGFFSGARGSPSDSGSHSRHHANPKLAQAMSSSGGSSPVPSKVGISFSQLLAGEIIEATEQEGPLLGPGLGTCMGMVEGEGQGCRSREGPRTQRMCSLVAIEKEACNLRHPVCSIRQNAKPHATSFS